MPRIAELLRPTHCPNHPHMLVEDYGVCCICGMTTHKHLSGFKLITDTKRVVYRSEAELGDEGIYDDD